MSVHIEVDVANVILALGFIIVAIMFLRWIIRGTHHG